MNKDIEEIAKKLQQRLYTRDGLAIEKYKQALTEAYNLGKADRDREIARKVIETRIFDESELLEEDFEGVEKVDVFIAGVTYLGNEVLPLLTTLTSTDNQTGV